MLSPSIVVVKRFGVVVLIIQIASDMAKPGTLRREWIRRLDFVSMGPISQKPISTSVIYRDANCFNI